MNVQILDLDNCISRDAWRQNLIDKSYKEDPYVAYHSAAVLDDPSNLGFIDQDAPTWILTGRPSYYRAQTVWWLNTKTHLTNYELYMRPANRRFLPAPDLKKYLYQVAKNLSEFKDGIVTIAYDDREDVLEAYRSLLIPTKRLFIDEHSTY